MVRPAAPRPKLPPDEFNATNVDVYAGLVGDDPEWEVTGTMAGFDPDLTQVRTRTLVLTGRWDRMTTPAIARQTSAVLPAADLHVFERSAHRPWAEQPDEYFAHVGEFLGG